MQRTDRTTETLCVCAAGSQKQETKLGGGTSRHCFNNLKPNMQYKMSIYAQLLDGTEGPAVTVTDKTRKDAPLKACLIYSLCPM